MKFPYEELYYLKARGPDDKRPAESWGGYSQNFDEADCVYTHEDVEMFPSSSWLVNGIQDNGRMPRHLLIFDLDIYKAPEDFDENRVSVPADTPVVKSQRGGFHVYFVISGRSERAQESDFKISDASPFDIDIRGEFVKHHVVAPNAVPGAESGYELVNDATIKHYFDPSDAAERITLDGEPLLEYNPSGGNYGSGYDRGDVTAPASMPYCYGAGLELRKQAPDDPSLNTHKVNVLTALAGLASGYETEAVVDHFVEEYYPGDPAQADREKTAYQVDHIAQKLDAGEYSPPSVSTLQQYSILPDDEWCACGLPGHDEDTANMSGYYMEDLQALARVHGVEADPYEDREALLKTCLYAREANPGLSDAKPPYDALVAVGEHIGLNFKEPEDRILGESSYNVAKRVYADLEPENI